MNVHQKINFREQCRRSRMVEYPLAAAPYPLRDYPKSNRKAAPTISYGPITDSHGDRCRFVENASRGLRCIGLAHDIDKRAVSHRGWCIEPDSYGGETMAGVVYRLPARNGRNRYLIGYADPWNNNCAFLDMAIVEASAADSGESEDTAELARQSDSFAEIRATAEREYQEAWQHARGKRQDMADAREAVTDALDLARGLREAGIANPRQYKSAMDDLADAIEVYRKAAGEAFEAAGYAKRWHKIDWRDCSP